MKIKELHLRNIASIENADINFENGLNDALTGTHSGVFLISGDTGAGKSVILDGISMALYKKTPRVEGVANKTKNDYTNSDGESVGINSLEQYTRLGISEKDECYSEIVFEGNDGKEYRAKLSLGIILGTKDKTTGKRPIKHRPPIWEVKVGNSGWQKVEAKTGQPILDAVGLSFEQFGRMAMLAQGQFASFLTGDKKERESILERLTNTEHFSLYGTAINRLFKKADEKKKQIEIELAANKNYILANDEVNRLNTELADKEKGKQNLDNQRTENDKKLAIVQTIESRRKEKSDAEHERDIYKDKISDDEYKDRKALVEDWDATVEQRKMLVDLNKAKKDLQETISQIDQLKNKFNLLSSDLLAEKKDCNLKSQDIETQKKWLDKKSDMAELYGKAGEVNVKLENFATEQSNKAKADAEIVRLQGLVQNLLNDVSSKTEQLETAKNKLKEKQDEIDSLTNERNALNPSEINQKLNSATTRYNNLDSLKKELKELENSNVAVNDLKAELVEIENKLNELRDIKKDAERKYNEAKSADDKARNMLNTMKMSVNDVIVNLRKQLYDEKVETCPLCGQHITKLHIDDDFKKLVTPLQEEQNRTANLLKEAENNFKTADGNYKTEEGIQSGKKTELERRIKDVEKKKISVNNNAKSLGLKLDDTLQSQVDTEHEKVTKEIKILKESQEKAESLQARINQLINEKKPLEDELEKAKKAKLEAETAYNENNTKIDNQKQRSGEAETNIGELVDDLHDLLAVAYPNWKNDVETTGKNLLQSADEYNSKKQKYDEDCLALGHQKEKIDRLDGYRKSILEIDATWESECKAERYACNNIESEWTKLFADCQTRREEKKAAEKIISEKSPILDEYYKESGKTEIILANIDSKQNVLVAYREYVSDIDGKYKLALDKIKGAEDSIIENMKEIGAESEEDIPKKDGLEQKKKDLSEQIGELDNNIGAINSKLKENSANTDKLKGLEKKHEESVVVFNKWNRLNKIFGGTRFRTLVQTYILRPLLNNANIYLTKITDRYTLTCSEDNEQLSILVLDKYNKNQVRSVTVLSGGERFMISLALSLALSSLNRSDMNVNILFIDEGFGTLDEKNLDSVMSTLERLQEIAGQSGRRVGIISHREELNERIPVQIRVEKKGEGRSIVKIVNECVM